MPKPLVNLGVSAPGFYGLNKQQSGDVLPIGWATEARNCVVDDVGRIASRKGSQQLNTTAITSTPTIRQIHVYVDGGGNELTILAAGNAIYKVAGSSLTDISGTITTPTADNWKFVNFNGKCVGFQSGHAPIVLSSVSGSFADISLSGTDQPTTAVDEVLSAYGRLWVIDGSSVLCSDSLDETAWNTVAISLNTVWLGGADDGTALADFNGNLVIFGKRSITIYANPWDPTDTAFQVVENIGGFGCIARDSVQYVGDDIIFLSGHGVRTLSRVIQEKSLPIGDLSKNIKDYLVDDVTQETAANIKSVFCKCGNFYLLSLPTAGKTFYFDLRARLEDGSAKVTEWDYASTALASSIAGTLYMARTAGYISKYNGYLDEKNSAGANGSTYEILYHGPWHDFGGEVSQLLKVLKRGRVYLLASQNQVVSLKIALDYVDTYRTYNIQVPQGTPSRYGVDTYTNATYGGTIVFTDEYKPVGRTGRIVKLGLQATVNDSQVAIQRIELQAKVGRLG